MSYKLNWSQQNEGGEDAAQEIVLERIFDLALFVIVLAVTRYKNDVGQTFLAYGFKVSRV